MILAKLEDRLVEKKCKEVLAEAIRTRESIEWIYLPRNGQPGLGDEKIEK